MKTLPILIVFLVGTIGCSFGQSVQPDGRTYALRTMTLKAGSDAQAFEAYAKEHLNPAFRQVPGITTRLAKADRGIQEGSYMLLYIYDSKATRDHYFPKEGAQEYSKAFLEVIPKIEKALRGLYAFVEEEPETSGYTDYILVE